MVAESDFIKPVIDSNDKTVLTDGHLEVYSSTEQTNENWLGRVTVQVKGRKRAPRKKGAPRPRISITELKGHQRNGGVLYFWVEIDPSTRRKTPYYASLTPFGIQRLLEGAEEAPGEATDVPVMMRRFPSDPESINRIVGVALRARDQNVSVGFDPVVLRNLESFTLYTTTDLDFSVPQTLSPDTSEYALVLNTRDGLSIPLPGDFEVIPQPYVPAHVTQSFSSGGVTFAGGVQRRVDRDRTEIVLSDGLTLVERTVEGRLGADLTLSYERSLSGRLKTMSFYVSVLETGAFEVDGVTREVEVVAGGPSEELRKHLNDLRQLADLFDALGADADLVDLTEISDEQYKQLRVLHWAVVEGNEVVDPELRVSRLLLSVGNWTLALLILPGQSDYAWRVLNSFSPELRNQYSWSARNQGDERTPVTAYDILAPEVLGTVLNLRADSIVEAYEAIAEFEQTYELANEQVRRLIHAADLLPVRAKYLLEAALRLNDWLILDNGSQPHDVVNSMQICHRLRDLTLSERNELRAIRRSESLRVHIFSLELEIACALLLADFEEADQLLEVATAEQIERMKSWPIWKLQADRGESGEPGTLPI